MFTVESLARDRGDVLEAAELQDSEYKMACYKAEDAMKVAAAHAKGEEGPIRGSGRSWSVTPASLRRLSFLNSFRATNTPL